MRSIFDPKLFEIAATQVKEAGRILGDMEKGAFVDSATAQAGDPASQGGGGAPPGLDPQAAASAMAPDSAQMQGVTGAPGGGGALTEDRVLQLIQQSQQAGTMGGGMGGGMGGMGGGEMGPGGKPKMKIDVNTEIYHIKRLMVGLYSALGLSVPADTLLGDPAEDPYATMQEAQQDPASAAAAPGAMESSIKPIKPVQGASPAAAAAGAGGAGGGGEKTSSLLREDGQAVPNHYVPSPLVGRAGALAALISQLS